MPNNNLIEHYKMLEEFIGSCYKKYKNVMNQEEREIIEEYLYSQREYEEAWGNLKAILEGRKIVDDECNKKLEEARQLMELPDNE